MEIRSIELRFVELDPVVPFRTANGLLRTRPISVVVLDTDRGVGFGECEALGEPTYSEEFARGAELVLGEHLLPRLLARSPDASVEELMASLEEVRGNPMAKAAIEMALLDAELHGSGQSFASYLGATHPSIKAGATIGIGSVQATLAGVEEAMAKGYERIKIKLDPRAGFLGVSAVIESYPDLGLVVDANGSLDEHDDRDLLVHLADAGLVGIEQPLAPGDLAAHARLVRDLGLPVILDESIGDLFALERAIAAKAMIGVSLKPARLGGLLKAHLLLERCRENGIGCCIGGMLESGIGRAAAIAFGACAGLDLPGDLGASDRYYSRDLTAPHLLRSGELMVPTGPGLGTAIDQGALEELTVAKRSFSKS